MVHLHEMPDAARDRLVNQDLPQYDDVDCVAGPPLSERKIAIVTTAGLHKRTDKPFTHSLGEYRIIPDAGDMNEIVMSHASTNFDRSGYQQDLNICFPVDRLRELQADGKIGSIATNHFSFMGASPPETQEAAARDLAGILKADGVNGVILTPV